MKYLWMDKRTKKQITVDRSFKEYEAPPYKDECLDTGLLTEQEYGEADWERLISGGQVMQRGPSWNGSKGNWGKS